MQDTLISFETAKLTKEKGFTNPNTLNCWVIDDNPKWNNKNTTKLNE